MQDHQYRDGFVGVTLPRGKLLRGRELTAFVSAPTATVKIAIAGVHASIELPLHAEYPPELDTFETDHSPSDLSVHVGSTARLTTSPLPLIFEGGSHWRACEGDGRLVFEMFYPPTGEVYCHLTGNMDRSRFTLEFGRENLDTVPGSAEAHLRVQSWFPAPFDQLAFVPALARSDGFLVHACGAVLDDRAYVLAGHSGDGKTTLSRLLADEGVELLSDERVAIRRVAGQFYAYGTPWHGDGNIVSSERYPLGGAFILRKGDEHRVAPGVPVSLTAEFLSRSIVPYYLTEETELILESVRQVAEAVPLRELIFARVPGIKATLEQFVSDESIVAC